MIGKRPKNPVMEEKVLDVDATMQGTMIFKDPVNLKINGRFEGSLTTRGNLTIGQSAEINADIIGENIVVSGRVSGDIIAEKGLTLLAPARVVGNIETPSLTVGEGAVLHGDCKMIFDEAQVSGLQGGPRKNSMTAEEVARYLEVDTSMVLEWANSGRLQGKKENNNWWFERSVVDTWVKNEKVR